MKVTRWLPAWLRRMTTLVGSAPRSSRTRRRARPTCEQLEDRITPTVTGYQAQGVLSIDHDPYSFNIAFTGTPSGPVGEAVNGTLDVQLTHFGVGAQGIPITFVI